MDPSEKLSLERDLSYGEAIKTVVGLTFAAADELHHRGDGPPVEDAPVVILVETSYDLFAGLAYESVDNEYLPSDSEVIFHDIRSEVERRLEDGS